MNGMGLSLSEICCLFCCPPCPAKIAAKLAFLPPETTYTFEVGVVFSTYVACRVADPDPRYSVVACRVADPDPQYSVLACRVVGPDLQYSVVACSAADPDPQ